MDFDPSLAVVRQREQRQGRSAKTQDLSHIWNLKTSCPKDPGFNLKKKITLHTKNQAALNLNEKTQLTKMGELLELSDKDFLTSCHENALANNDKHGYEARWIDQGK
jgi:hypothetical protein